MMTDLGCENKKSESKQGKGISLYHYVADEFSSGV